MNPTPKGELLNVLVRMVVPMRREFGRSLDVRQFMRDGSYARGVLDEALGSRDPRLLEYARYVDRMLNGPRIASNAVTPQAAAAAPAPAAAPPAGMPAAPQAPAAGAPAASDEDLRQAILRKYTTGLR